MLLLPLLACAGPSGSKTPTGTGHTGSPVESAPTTDTEPSGACGEPVNYDMTVVGLVETPTGLPADATTLELEDRGWIPGRILGTATTDGYGAFSLEATDVTSLDDCWGTLLDYVVVARRAGPGGPQSAELGLNTPLFNAIQDGTLVADLGKLPITLEDEE
jgi:hypothetical protein